MKTDRYNLWENGEYTYSKAFGFCPNITTYLHEDDSVRPAIVVVPGGGYYVVSPTEAEIVAKAFYEFGYQTFVVTYTVNPLFLETLHDQPMKDLSRAIRFVRKHSAEFRVNPSRVAICGFSAGGHLCGSVCVHYNDVAEANPEYSAFSNRPDAAILSYPVITSGPYAHRGSFDALIGFEPTTEDLEYMSLEKQVTPDTPPCFLWQTATDELVPVENSYLFADACKKNGVPYAHHIFSNGVHGLSLSNDDWKNHKFGTPYTLEQIYCLVDALKSGLQDADEEGKQALISGYNSENQQYGEHHPAPQAAIWPLLAHQWLEENM